MTNDYTVPLIELSTLELADLVEAITAQESMTPHERDRRIAAIMTLRSRHPFVDDQFTRAALANVDSSIVAYVAAAAARIEYARAEAAVHAPKPAVLQVGDKIWFWYRDPIHGFFEAEGEIKRPVYDDNGELVRVHVSVGTFRSFAIEPCQILDR